MIDHRRQRVRWICISSIYVFVLYATLPLGRPVVTFMRDHLDKSEQSFLIYTIFATVAAAFLGYVLFKIRTFTPTALVCLALLMGMYYLEFSLLVKYPEERLHFLEYGLLALLLYKTFSIDFKGLRPYQLTFITGGIIGYGDELIQHCTKYLPGLFNILGITSVNPDSFRRYFGWEDVRINILGVVYGLVLISMVLLNRRTRPQPQSQPQQESHQ
jgi:hypothetical protein